MFDVFCESTIQAPPPDAPGAGTRAHRDLITYAEAQAAADDFVRRFGQHPDVRVIIYDQDFERSIVVHEATA